MYRKFDEDADGILSFMETNKFMVATGNKPFNENQWQAVCKMAGGANPDSTGPRWSRAHLFGAGLHLGKPLQLHAAHTRGSGGEGDASEGGRGCAP